jgi:large conductance mechanosensitive channel
MSVLRDVRMFVVAGQGADLVIGIGIGGAFATMLSSLVKDIVFPLVGNVLGGVDPNLMVIVLRASHPASQALVVNIGIFLGHVVAFILLLATASVVVKAVVRERIEWQRPPRHSGLTTTEKLLTEIRDAIRASHQS